MRLPAPLFPHHEVQVGALIGEFSLDVQKVRTGNMSGRESVETGYGDVRDITSRWLVVETGRTIENANVGLVQNLRKLFSTDEFAALEFAAHESPHRQ
jgi:hypothetical protein